MAGLYAPLPTLRRHPRGSPRTARGRCGSLLLHRSGLAPPTPCRSPGALTRVAARTLARSPIRDQLRDCLDPDNTLAICGSHLRRVAYCPAECDPSSDTSVKAQDNTPCYAVG